MKEDVKKGLGEDFLFEIKISQVTVDPQKRAWKDWLLERLSEYSDKDFGPHRLNLTFEDIVDGVPVVQRDENGVNRQYLVRIWEIPSFPVRFYPTENGLGFMVNGKPVSLPVEPEDLRTLHSAIIALNRKDKCESPENWNEQVLRQELALSDFINNELYRANTDNYQSRAQAENKLSLLNSVLNGREYAIRSLNKELARFKAAWHKIQQRFLKEYPEADDGGEWTPKGIAKFFGGDVNEAMVRHYARIIAERPTQDKEVNFPTGTRGKRLRWTEPQMKRLVDCMRRHCRRAKRA